jgi:hypothetical protein
MLSAVTMRPKFQHAAKAPFLPAPSETLDPFERDFAYKFIYTFARYQLSLGYPPDELRSAGLCPRHLRRRICSHSSHAYRGLSRYEHETAVAVVQRMLYAALGDGGS